MLCIIVEEGKEYIYIFFEFLPKPTRSLSYRLAIVAFETSLKKLFASRLLKQVLHQMMGYRIKSKIKPP